MKHNGNEVIDWKQRLPCVVIRNQKGSELISPDPLFLEAATGFEPVNNGFADRCLSHLAMPPLSTGAGERI